MANQRSSWLSRLRIFAILGVIQIHGIGLLLTHAELVGTKGWWLANILNSFSRAGVPLFFMISGHLLLGNDKTKDVFRFYKRRFSKLLPPLLFFNVFYYFYRAVFDNAECSIGDFLSKFFDIGTEYHLWYLYTIAGLYLFLPFIARALENLGIAETLVFATICLFGHTLKLFINNVSGWSLHLFEPLTNGFFGYMLVGYLLGRYSLPKLWRYILIIVGIGFAAVPTLQFYFGATSELVSTAANGPYELHWFMIATGIFLLFKTDKVYKSDEIWDLLGNLTFGVYLIHPLFLDIIYKQLVAPKPSIKNLLLIAAISTLMSFLGTYVFSKLQAFFKKIIATRRNKVKSS